jgi:hypothetical protein
MVNLSGMRDTITVAILPYHEKDGPAKMRQDYVKRNFLDIQLQQKRKKWDSTLDAHRIFTYILARDLLRQEV